MWAALCENVEGSFLCLCASDLEEYDAQEGRCRPRGAGGEPCAPPSDESDKSPGWKFSEAEMRGVSLRVEIGPRDMEAGKCVIVRRDTRAKEECLISDVAETCRRIMGEMQSEMLSRAKAHLQSHISDAHDYEEFKKTVEEKPGFIRAMWCGDEACELKIKEDTTATSRCMPFEQEMIDDKCVCCGKPAKKLVFWGKAY